MLRIEPRSPAIRANELIRRFRIFGIRFGEASSTPLEFFRSPGSRWFTTNTSTGSSGNRYHNPMHGYDPLALSLPYVWHAQITDSSKFSYPLFQSMPSKSHCRRRMDDVCNLKSCLHDLFTSSYQKLTELVPSQSELSLKDKSSTRCGHRGPGIQQQHDICQGIPSLTFTSSEVLESDLSHPSDRL